MRNRIVVIVALLLTPLAYLSGFRNGAVTALSFTQLIENKVQNGQEGLFVSQRDVILLEANNFTKSSYYLLLPFSSSPQLDEETNKLIDKMIERIK